MRVVAFTKTSAIGPSSRYRYYQFQGPLKDHGIDLRIRPLFGAGWFAILRVRSKAIRLVLQTIYTLVRFANRALQLAFLPRVDLVVVEHQLFPYLSAFAERRLKRRDQRFTIEFDDAIYKTRRHGEKMAELCRLADLVVVGNRFLADYVRAQGGKAEIVPTTIDLSRYGAPAPVREDPRPFTIGWIGLPYNFTALEALLEPLHRLLAAHGGIELHVVSAGLPSLPNVPLRRVEWSEASEIESIRRFDVGVMPLPDDEWARGKCALKILQYFAAGVPVVASPVGVNAEIVVPGENGLLARTPEEWYEALSRLAGVGAAHESAAALRSRLAAQGRRTVELHFSRDAWTPKLARIWFSVADDPHRNAT